MKTVQQVFDETEPLTAPLSEMNQSERANYANRTEAGKFLRKKYSKKYNERTDWFRKRYRDDKEFRERIRKTSREFYWRNREKCLAKSKKYYEENKEKKTEYHKEWFEKNKKRINKRERERYANDKAYRERRSEISRRYHLRKKERKKNEN